MARKQFSHNLLSAVHMMLNVLRAVAARSVPESLIGVVTVTEHKCVIGAQRAARVIFRNSVHVNWASRGKELSLPRYYI